MKMKKITIFLLSIACLAIISCGKKGPLILEPELIPPIVNNLTISQIGSNIKLEWDFPARFTDKKKSTLIPEMIDKISIYYSDKIIPNGKYESKADVIRKLKFTDLIIVPKSTSTDSDKKNQPSVTTYSVLIPFKTKDLDNKDHYMAVQYSYQKEKSPLSSIVVLHSMVPVKPVSGLTITRENKVIKIKWQKPQTDEANRPVLNIAGYNIFRKVESNEIPQDSKTQDKGKPAEDPKQKPLIPVGFVQINKDNVLTEYFEDNNTGATGKYSYYVSTIISNQIQSEISEISSFDFTDIYPPDIPQNVSCFRMSEQQHMFVTWLSVKDNDLAYYRVYRRASEKGEYKLLADKVTTNNYKDFDVQKGNVYYYFVTAVDLKGNESNPSKESKEQF